MWILVEPSHRLEMIQEPDSQVMSGSDQGWDSSLRGPKYGESQLRETLDAAADAVEKAKPE